MIAVYPGSFDPLTNGHFDIIKRAARSFDRVFVVVFDNSAKKTMFTVEERMSFLKDACKDIPNVTVDASSGLLVEYAKKVGAGVIVKGLRAVSDFDYEFKMALMNKKLCPDIETFFMMTSLKYLYLSSALVKEVASYGGCIRDLVPPAVEDKVFERLGQKKPQGNI
ncbi:MAG: pantetheine-phosphate adenylyltransferase [Bacillota bacterium]